MKRQICVLLAAFSLTALSLAGCTAAVPGPTVPAGSTAEASGAAASPTAEPTASPAAYDVTPGGETYRDFVLDNVYHSDIGDIHFNLYVPESYDGGTPYALFITLPGYQGLYFQGTDRTKEMRYTR